MKNILFIWNDFSNMGGVERIILKTFRLFDKNRYKKYLCCLFGKKKMHDILLSDIKKEGIQIFTLNTTVERFSPKALLKLAHLMHTLKIDIIRSYSIYANRYGLLAARLAGVKNVVCSYHSIYSFPVSRKTYFMDTIIYSNCKALIVSSEKMKQHCLTRFHFNPSKIFIVNDGLNLKDLPVYIDKDKEKTKQTLKINKEKIIITVGRLEPVKKFDLLIESFNSIEKQFPDVILLIIGDGSQKDSLASLVAHLNLSEKVRFLGYQKNVFHFLSIADIFILTSQYEGSPLVVLEAMAMGLPVVSTDVGNCRELLTHQDYECGIIFPVGDKDKLISDVLSLLKNGKKRKEMSSLAKERIENDFSLEKEKRFYDQLFDAL
ncbi:MAG: glycosyltransferase [Candidatus Omnitrophota bacterium]